MEILRILLGESLVELLDFVQQDLQLVIWWQDGHSVLEGRGKERQKLTVVTAGDDLRPLQTNSNIPVHVTDFLKKHIMWKSSIKFMAPCKELNIDKDFEA